MSTTTWLEEALEPLRAIQFTMPRGWARVYEVLLVVLDPENSGVRERRIGVRDVLDVDEPPNREAKGLVFVLAAVEEAGEAASKAGTASNKERRREQVLDFMMGVVDGGFCLKSPGNFASRGILFNLKIIIYVNIMRLACFVCLTSNVA